MLLEACRTSEIRHFFTCAQNPFSHSAEGSYEDEHWAFKMQERPSGTKKPWEICIWMKAVNTFLKSDHSCVHNTSNFTFSCVHSDQSSYHINDWLRSIRILLMYNLSKSIIWKGRNIGVWKIQQLPNLWYARLRRSPLERSSIFMVLCNFIYHIRAPEFT